MTDEEPRGELTMQLVPMLADANSNGDIFGGWVMSQMDIAAGIAACGRSHGRTTTVAVDAMQFIRPVLVGDTFTVYTDIEKIGRTSMVIHTEAWTRRLHVGEPTKVTEAKFTYVALDDNGRPKPVPAE